MYVGSDVFISIFFCAGNGVSSFTEEVFFKISGTFMELNASYGISKKVFF